MSNVGKIQVKIKASFDEEKLMADIEKFVGDNEILEQGYNEINKEIYIQIQDECGFKVWEYFELMNYVNVEVK